MASPTCPKCGNRSFEAVDLEVRNSDRRHKAVICSHCGCIVAVEEQQSVLKLVKELAKKAGISVPC